MTPHITPKDHQKEVQKSLSESRRKFQNSLTDNGNDVNNFLKSGKSYNQYNRDRMDLCFESPDQAEKRMEEQLRKEGTGRKPIKHHANFGKYIFDKDAFLQNIREKPRGSLVNWTRLAREYNVTCHGKFPLNAGQVLYEFAKYKKVDVSSFNRSKRIAGRDYRRRIRRAKKNIIINKRKVPMPAPRTIKQIKEDVHDQLKSGKLYIGVRVAPKQLIKTKIDQTGELVKVNQEI